MPPSPDLTRPASADRQTELLEQALRQTRWNLALSVLLLLGYAAAVACGVYFARHGVKKKEDQLLGAVRDRLLQDVGPLTDEAADLAADVAPPVADAFVDQLKRDLPTLTRTAEGQSKEVTDHLEATLRKDLEAHYRAALPRYRAILKQQFPEVTDEATLDRMADQFQAAFQKLIRRYYLKAYRDRAERTTQLWKAIPPAEAPPAGTKALTDQLGDDLAQWVQTKMVEGGVRPAPRGDGK
jgi:hypothetical protein